MLPLWSSSNSPRCSSRSPYAKVRLSLPPTWRSGVLDRRLCSFSFWQRRLWHTCQQLSGNEVTLYFSAGSVYSSFSAEACTILQALLLVSAAPTSLPLPLSSYLTLALSSSPSFLLPQSLWQIWQELSYVSSCSIRLQWVPGYLFLPRNDAADELARRRALLVLKFPDSL